MKHLEAEIGHLSDLQDQLEQAERRYTLALDRLDRAAADYWLSKAGLIEAQLDALKVEA